MAVAVCYHARLQERDQFEEVIVQYFKPPYHIPGGKEQFVEEIFMYAYCIDRQYMYRMAGNIGVELNLVVGGVNIVSPNINPLTFNSYYKNLGG